MKEKSKWDKKCTHSKQNNTVGKVRYQHQQMYLTLPTYYFDENHCSSRFHTLGTGYERISSKKECKHGF